MSLFIEIFQTLTLDRTIFAIPGNIYSQTNRLVDTFIILVRRQLTYLTLATESSSKYQVWSIHHSRRRLQYLPNNPHSFGFRLNSFYSKSYSRILFILIIIRLIHVFTSAYTILIWFFFLKPRLAHAAFQMLDNLWVCVYFLKCLQSSKSIRYLAWSDRVRSSAIKYVRFRNSSFDTLMIISSRKNRPTRWPNSHFLICFGIRAKDSSIISFVSCLMLFQMRYWILVKKCRKLCFDWGYIAATFLVGFGIVVNFYPIFAN